MDNFDNSPKIQSITTSPVRIMGSELGKSSNYIPRSNMEAMKDATPVTATGVQFAVSGPNGMETYVK